MDKNKIIKISNLISSFSEEISRIYNAPLRESFIIAVTLLSIDKLPVFDNINEDDIKLITKYHHTFGSLEYSKHEMRRAFVSSYLDSLKTTDNYTVDVSLELPQLFFKTIVEEIYKSFTYTNINVLNPYANISSLACLLSISGVVDEKNIDAIVNDSKQETLSIALKKLTQTKFNIQSELKELSYRCDIIFSDPFLTNVPDILVFFEDYNEYLNQSGFMVVSLPTEFVRSRIFSDLIMDHDLGLIMLINYPEDMLEGIMKSSIVILQKGASNKEFSMAEMKKMEDVEGNLEILSNVKEELNKYLRGEEK